MLVFSTLADTVVSCSLCMVCIGANSVGVMPSISPCLWAVPAAPKNQSVGCTSVKPPSAFVSYTPKSLVNRAAVWARVSWSSGWNSVWVAPVSSPWEASTRTALCISAERFWMSVKSVLFLTTT